jgi:hypothetical protein
MEEKIMKSAVLRIVAISIFAFLVCETISSAMGSIIYDESVSGDLAASPPFKTLTLQPGLSSIKGSQFFDNTVLGACCSDRDSFSFVVPQGMHLRDISYEFAVTGSTSSSDTGLALLGGADLNGTKLGHEFVALGAGNDTVELFATALPLGPGTYTISNDSLAVATGEKWASHYTVHLVIASGLIPEPSVSVALATGLFAMLTAFLYRRRISR